MKTKKVDKVITTLKDRMERRTLQKSRHESTTLKTIASKGNICLLHLVFMLSLIYVNTSWSY